MSTTTELPDDVICDIILPRLPAKSLLRFRCVCESWCDIISGRDFTNRHLQRSLTTKSNLFVVFSRDGMPFLHLANIDTFENPVQLKHPFMRYHGSISIVGCCKGLVCIRNNHKPNIFESCLFNPTTRTYKILTLPHSPRNRYDNHLYGFGYDAVSDDLKCVCISQIFDYKSNVMYNQVWVYTMKTNKWSFVLMDIRKRAHCVCSSGVFVDGNLNWVMECKGTTGHLISNYILGFDISKHIFSEMPLPESATRWHCYSDCGMVNECFSVVINNRVKYEIWVMKEYGVADSWARLYQVELKSHAVRGLVTYTLKEIVIHINKEKFICFDLETMETKPSATWHSYFTYKNVLLCVENLVRLDLPYESIVDRLDTGQGRRAMRHVAKSVKN